jgi:hypothetical protein
MATVNSDLIKSIWKMQQPIDVVHFQADFDICGGITFSENDEFFVVGTDEGMKAFRLKQLIPPGWNCGMDIPGDNAHH